ncbi:MAG: galactokinase [Fimbriimonadaceae bacterium]|nr:galactokinase [Fimbriimonadaceae bacterium]
MALAIFEDRYGGMATHIAFAPGRVNLIGEHTDYSEGLVMPMAIPYGVAVAFRATDGPSRLHSIARGPSKSFSVIEVVPGSRKGWSGYAAGMAWALKDRGHQVKTNIEAVVEANLPIGSGVSSSAALEVAFGLAWKTANGLTLTPLELARLAQHCENKFVGVNCGLMDMAASTLGVAGHALKMDIRSMETEPIPLPPGLVVVLCDTGKSRGLASSHYNLRREEVQRACDGLGVSILREISFDQLEKGKIHLDDVAYRRARHVVTENVRVGSFATALRTENQLEIRRLLNEAHASIRDDFEASCAELDAMAEIANSVSGCWGARMTGGGFGGACVALVTELAVDIFVNTVNEAYVQRFPTMEPRFLICEASDGAEVTQIGT